MRLASIWTCTYVSLGFLFASRVVSTREKEFKRILTTDNDNNESLEELLEFTKVVTEYDWEWVLIRINEAAMGVENADLVGAADTQVIVTALEAGDPPIRLHRDRVLSRFDFGVQAHTNEPDWYEIGMVAYQIGTVSQIEILLQDMDLLRNMELIRATVDIPTEYDRWIDVPLLVQDAYALNVSLWRSTTPVFTEDDQRHMNLTEVLFQVGNGTDETVASLAYNTNPENDKAVLYFPGRSESFGHPQVLQMYQDMGYDLYTLDPRWCGRTRRFLDEDNFRFGHSIENFDLYAEEIDLTLEHIRSTKNYTQLLAHMHSTGTLVALNYVMMLKGDQQEEPFDGYILNGPFLDWGHVGGLLSEAFVENAATFQQFLGVELATVGRGLSSFHTRNWIKFRYNTTLRPLIRTHITTDWAQAATNVQNKILETPVSDPIAQNPVLMIASLGDNTILPSEAQKRMPHVASNYTEIIMTHNAHDVTQSATPALNDEAIADIGSWIVTNFGEAGTSPSNLAVDAEETAAPTNNKGVDVERSGENAAEPKANPEESAGRSRLPGLVVQTLIPAAAVALAMGAA